MDSRVEGCSVCLGLGLRVLKDILFLGRVRLNFRVQEFEGHSVSGVHWCQALLGKVLGHVNRE